MDKKKFRVIDYLVYARNTLNTVDEVQFITVTHLSVHSLHFSRYIPHACYQRQGHAQIESEDDSQGNDVEDQKPGHHHHLRIFPIEPPFWEWVAHLKV
ncbi:hypothetical protein GWI33_009556 [Rhynchophorus ferrugineus]|uniref:Uncharacterized protein n=1 Tax=Rhynchophorus ferrugineus TaxID=354439 RepID=A0A834M9Q6_RHYFE|nr:hypothetical protein GWI33_009556 [Rhynchophorus ferrugineus]